MMSRSRNDRRSAIPHDVGQQTRTVIIPYFSSDDPAINVFVDFHGPELGQGIVWVRPDLSERLSIGKLILNRGPEHLDSVIKKIQDLKLIVLIQQLPNDKCPLIQGCMICSSKRRDFKLSPKPKGCRSAKTS